MIPTARSGVLKVPVLKNPSWSAPFCEAEGVKALLRWYRENGYTTYNHKRKVSIPFYMDMQGGG